MSIDRKIDEKIDALLQSGETASVIDSFFSIPYADDSCNGEWEQILHARLQQRLAHRMRALIALEENPATSADRSA